MLLRLGGAALLALGLALPACAGFDYTPPSTPEKPASHCDHGKLSACAESCRAGLEGACDALGARTCKEGSILECRAACDGDNLAACDALAEMYENGDRVDRDDDQAIALHDRACAKGRRSSCTAAGDDVRQEMTKEGADTERLTERAIRYFDAGCDKSKPDEGDWSTWTIPWTTGPSNLACAQLVLLAPERILPALEAKCGDPSRYHPDKDREYPDACAILAGGKTIPRAAKELGLRQLCARDPQSESCGRLKDLAVTAREGAP
jgi:hypothetical protein